VTATTCQHLHQADGLPPWLQCPHQATWSVGGRGYSRLLCDGCAALPQYRRFTRRRRLAGGLAVALKRCRPWPWP
jgi:hypothetical protein